MGNADSTIWLDPHPLTFVSSPFSLEGLDSLLDSWCWPFSQSYYQRDCCHVLCHSLSLQWPQGLLISWSWIWLFQFTPSSTEELWEASLAQARCHLWPQCVWYWEVSISRGPHIGSAFRCLPPGRSPIINSSFLPPHRSSRKSRQHLLRSINPSLPGVYCQDQVHLQFFSGRLRASSHS